MGDQGQLPTEWGHDLYPVYGDPHKIWVSTVEDVYQFDTRTKTFDPDFPGAAEIGPNDVKGIGTQPFTGNIVRVIPNGTLEEWDTNTIDLFVKGPNGYTQTAHKSDQDAYYKVRAWYYKYQ